MERAVTIDDVLAVIDKMSQETKALFRETEVQQKETFAELRALQQENSTQIQGLGVQQKETFVELRALQQENSIQIQELGVQQKETFAELKALQQENSIQIQELGVQQKETFAELRALQQETAVQLRKTAAQIEETNKKMGDLSNRFGEVVEYIVSPHLERKFKSLGITLNTVAMEQVIYDDEGKRIAEIDIFMSNGEYAVAVEVKAKPNQKDVKNHVKRMEKIREHADKHNDKKKYIGAIAGMIISDKVKNCAFEHGFPVLVPSGDGVELVYPEGFSPTEW